MFPRAGIASTITALCGAAFAAEPQVDSSQLPRVPPTEATNAIATFRVKPGFRLELAAAEPLVVDPIALSFDEDGRLYVVEMRDYSERRPERLGRIRLLEDTDGDGRYEKSTVFAKDLPWPTAVICWDGGVFVGSTPDILYFKDTNDDGVADVHEVIFTGFASDYAPFATNKLNVQALMNSFNWSLDNRIHGATSFSGGKVKLVDSPFVREWLKRGSVPEAGRAGLPRSSEFPSNGARAKASIGGGAPPPYQELDLRGRDFSFDPRTLEMRAESGGGQHGLSFDNRGRKYVCSNSSHIQTLMYEERYAARNSYYNMPRALVDIAVDGGAAPVFRISPDEPWRVIRTQWRVAGLVPGPIEGGGRASGYFTGATGVTIYRGDALGEDFVGDAFVGDAGGNLVHRKKILPDGVGVRAERPADEQNVEFLASIDNWFRPVQFANGPDGALYICDMYREVIEHPWSLPDSIKKYLDLNSGNDRGRIYRVVPTNFTRPKPPRMSKVTITELVKALESPNGWMRDTATRLLYQRQDKSAVPELRYRLSPLHSSQTVIQALYALAGLWELSEEDVRYALWHKGADVRWNAWKLAVPFLANPSPDFQAAVRRQASALIASGDDAAVMFQFVLALGEVTHWPDLLQSWDYPFARDLGKVAPVRLRENSPAFWIDSAALGSLQQDAFGVLSSPGVVRIAAPDERHAAFVGNLARIIGARNNTNEIAATLLLTNVFFRRTGERISTLPDPVVLAEVLCGLDDGLRQAGTSLVAATGNIDLSQRYQFLAEAARSRFRSENARLAAIKGMATAPYSEARTNLLPILVDPSSPHIISRAVISAMAKLNAAAVASDLVQAWPGLTPALRTDALAALLQRAQRIEILLGSIERGEVLPKELSVAHVDALRNLRDERLRQRAIAIMGKPAGAERQDVIFAYQPALALMGDSSRGPKIFAERCAACHKLGNAGHALGPDLATVRAAGKEKLLTNILDPNREVAPNFLAYSIDTKDGDSFTGVVINESASSITLRQANSVESVVARLKISSMQSQGKSLMPEGLEAGLSQQDMADLLEFIVNPPPGN